MTSQRLPRLLLDEPIGSRRALVLSAVHANYLNRVLRLRLDSRIIVFDGQGGEHMARITGYKKDAALIEIMQAIPVIAEPGLRVLLLQGISKGDRMDFAVQKSTELGVAEIFPVYTQFSVVRLDQARAARRVTHWQRIAGSACEQSGRHAPPRVHGPEPLDSCIQHLPAGGLRLAFDPSGARDLGEVDESPQAVAALIGPEGGFSPDELESLPRAGFELIRLGSRTLRTETAALVACALLQARWGDLSGSQNGAKPG